MRSEVGKRPVTTLNPAVQGLGIVETAPLQFRQNALSMPETNYEHDRDPVRHDGHRMRRRRDAGGGTGAGLVDEVGTLEPGTSADFAVWSIERPAELV